MKTLQFTKLIAPLALMVLATSCSLDNSGKSTPSPRNINNNVAAPVCQTCNSEWTYTEPAPYVALPGTAWEIAETDSGFPHILSNDGPSEAHGARIYYRNANYASNTDPWIYAPSPGAVYIASGGQKIWIVTDQGLLYSGFASSWTQFTSNNQPTFSAAATSGDESRLFALGTTNIPGGHPVYLYDQSSNSWSQVGTQGGVRIFVDNFGRPWIITDTGELYRSAGYGQTFSGWNSMARPNNSPVTDIAQYKSYNGPTPTIPVWSILVLSRPTLTSDENKSVLYWQAYPTTTAQTAWSNGLGGTGRRISDYINISIISRDYRIWLRPM